MTMKNFRVRKGLTIAGETSGSSSFNNSATGTDISYTLPTAQGASNTVLTNNGSGVLSWALPGGGGSTFGNITIAVDTDNTIGTTTGNLILSPESSSYTEIISNAGTPTTITRNTSSTAVVTRALILNSQSTGTPAVGFGTSVEFQTEAQPSTTVRSGSVNVISTDLTAGTEDFKMVFALMANGVIPAEKASLTSTGFFQTQDGIRGTYFNVDGGGVIDKTTATTSSTTPNQVAGSWNDATTFRSLKWQVQMTAGTEYQALEIMMVHDGSTVFLNTYGDVRTGTNLATFTADISGGTIRLLATPTYATLTTYRSIVTAINV